MEQIPQMYIPMIRGMFTDKPYIEGAWMDKHEGRYYLQYAFAGTQYNTYGDGVYVSDKPLGPFTPDKKQSIFLSSGWIYARCRSWFYDGGL